ncbi:hypothetical protein H0A36_23540 [Endozoicomonas sp. SM1973]|uniref:Uncharacterized protein n=1 Tax=Spartinivicinus marinus TaxID=2994442 RepID=A0A853IEN6_9GAMM|nr:hypothetical protein [Spartinivicinus marinus]MCX4025048.1 hypothetical protein [Spartinivicinus marinus]NYZ68998.1 hypothetical protein [Spartinivicinus marinus]
MQIYQLLSAITQTIHSHLPDLKDVSTHAGRFDLGEVKRVANYTPAVKVALMEAWEFKSIETEQWDVSLRLAAFVMVSDSRKLPKDEAAINIIEALSLLIAEQRWGVEGVLAASGIKASNLFSTQTDRQGLAIWGVTWDQVMRLKENIWQPSQVIPSRLYVADDESEFGQEERYDLLNG